MMVVVVVLGAVVVMIHKDEVENKDDGDDDNNSGSPDETSTVKTKRDGYRGDRQITHLGVSGPPTSIKTQNVQILSLIHI